MACNISVKTTIVTIGVVFGFLSAIAHAQPSSRDVALRNPAPTEAWRQEGFDPAESAGLFVGVGKFRNSNDFSEIPFAVDDAVDLAHLFSLELGLIFPSKVILRISGKPAKDESKARLRALIDAKAHIENTENTNFISASQILQDLFDQRRASGERGLLVVSMATHGFSFGGDSFLIAGESLESMVTRGGQTGIKLNTVIAEVSLAKAPRRLVLLDVCRERFTRAAQSDSAMAMPQSFADEISQSTGQAILIGSTPGGFAYDDQVRGNGVFSASVIDGLQGQAPKDSRGFITAATLADYVQERVQDWIRTHRPEHWERCETICGITRKITGDAAKLPLAIVSNRSWSVADLERHRAEAIELLLDNIGAALTPEMFADVSRVLLEDAAPTESLRSLIEAIHRLDGTLSSRHSLALYLDQHLESLVALTESALSGIHSLPTLQYVSGTRIPRTVVGRSDRIPITLAPQSSRTLGFMNPLEPYFVLDSQEDYLRVVSTSSESLLQGFVRQDHVLNWNSRQGLHFKPETLQSQRRRTVTAWDSLDKIRQFARYADVAAYGPAIKELSPVQVRSPNQSIPYPVLDSQLVLGVHGENRWVHKVLIPVLSKATNSDGVFHQVNNLTICFVFDATVSLGVEGGVRFSTRFYARRFARMLDAIRAIPGIDSHRVSLGFVLFRDQDASQPYEIVAPMPFAEAIDWFLNRVNKSVTFTQNEKAPVLDALMLAQNEFDWEGGSAAPDAARILLVAANEDAEPWTVGLDASVPSHLDVKSVARNLLTSSVVPLVLTVQAGYYDGHNLVNVLSRLAIETGGEFYRSNHQQLVPDDALSRRLAVLIGQLTQNSQANLEKNSIIDHRIRSYAEKNIIAVSSIDESSRVDLLPSNSEIRKGGLIMQSAWVFDDPSLYERKNSIDRESVEGLLTLFESMVDEGTLESASQILQSIAAEQLASNQEIQELLEFEMGIGFPSNFLSFPLEALPLLTAEEWELLVDRLHTSTISMASFLDENSTRYDKEPYIWMPTSYLP